MNELVKTIFDNAINTVYETVGAAGGMGGLGGGGLGGPEDGPEGDDNSEDDSENDPDYVDQGPPPDLDSEEMNSEDMNTSQTRPRGYNPSEELHQWKQQCFMLEQEKENLQMMNLSLQSGMEDMEKGHEKKGHEKGHRFSLAEPNS